MSIIDDYRNSSDNKKCELLEEIEFEDVPEKWELLRAVIADKGDYDLARVQALKILEIAAIPEEHLPAFGELLVAIIKTDQDYDVKNYAVIASSNFINDSDELKALIVGIVLDVEEDIDVRHNAYRAVMAFFDVPGRKVVLEKLSTDKEFATQALRDLAQYHSSAE